MIRAAQQDRHTSVWPGEGEGEPVTGPRAGPSFESSGWAQPFAKKDNAGRRYITNPAGLFDWRHGVPVRATFYLNRN